MAKNRQDLGEAILRDAIRLDSLHGDRNGCGTLGETVTDLLADIHRYCDAHELDYQDLHYKAYSQYSRERDVETEQRQKREKRATDRRDKPIPKRPGAGSSGARGGRARHGGTR